MDNKRNVRILILSFPILCLILQPVSSYAGSDDIEAEENESFDQSPISSEFDLSGRWFGAYIDNNVSDFVSRNISFNITNCDTQSGSFDGNAEIDNGDGGGFHFTGAINYETMDFSLIEDGAAENPDDMSLKTFTGIVSDDCSRISGIVNSDKYGIFSVERISEEEESAQNEENGTDDENSTEEESEDSDVQTESEESAESKTDEESETSQDEDAVQELESLQAELDDKKNENEILQAELDDTTNENEMLQSELDKMKSENEMLKKILEENEIEYD